EDVQPVGQHDDVLLAADQDEVAVRVEVPNVARVVAAELIERAGCRFGIVPVAAGHGRPRDEDLAIVSELQLDRGLRLPQAPARMAAVGRRGRYPRLGGT